MSQTQTRRHFIGLLLAGSGAGLVAACSPAAPAAPAAAPTAAPPAAPAQAAPSVAAAPAAAASPAAAAAKPAGAGLDVQAVYAAAKSEGQVSFVFPLTPEVTDVYSREWAKAYPGVQLQMTNASSDVAVQKALLEIQAGRVTIDLTDPSRDTRVQDLDVAAPLTDVMDALNIPPARRFANDRYALYAPLGHGVVYNKDRVAAADVPKTWDDLLSPKFKGQMVVEGRLKGFISMTDLPAYKGRYPGLLPEDQITDFLTRLKAQQPVILQGNSPVAAGLASGEYAISPDLNFGSFGQIYWAQKAPVDLAPVSPISTELWLMFIPKAAPHPNAAKLLLYWTIGEGLKARAQAFQGYEMDPGSGDPIVDVLKAKGVTVAQSGIELYSEYTRLETRYKTALGIPTS